MIHCKIASAVSRKISPDVYMHFLNFLLCSSQSQHSLYIEITKFQLFVVKCDRYLSILFPVESNKSLQLKVLYLLPLIELDRCYHSGKFAICLNEPN